MSYEGFGEGGDKSLSYKEQETLKDQIDAMWAWLIEKGAEDKTTAKQIRKTLTQHLKKLNVLNEDGTIDLKSWLGFVTSLADRKTTPVKPTDYPSFSSFTDRFRDYANENPKVLDLAYHTHDLEGYLYGLGMVISSQPVYESLFENDEIQIRNGEVVNGKHREASIDILRRCGFVKNTPWVKYTYED